MSVAFYFPDMYVNHIEESGLKVPPDVEEYNDHEYPHWTVFVTIHLGRPFDSSTLKANAEAIAKIPRDKIESVTLEDLEGYGVDIHSDPVLD